MVGGARPCWYGWDTTLPMGKEAAAVLHINADRIKHSAGLSRLESRGRSNNFGLTFAPG